MDSTTTTVDTLDVSVTFTVTLDRSKMPDGLVSLVEVASATGRLPGIALQALTDTLAEVFLPEVNEGSTYFTVALA